LLSIEESLTLFEKEFIKVLINQGHQRTADEEHAYEYLFRESQDVDFHVPLHQEIVDHYKIEVAKGDSLKPDVFLKSLSPEAASYVSGFLVQKYYVSDGWKKHNIYIGDEYGLEQSSLKVIMQLKLGIIVKMLTDNLQKIKETTDKKEQNELLEIQTTIDGYKNTIASSLGRIVLPSMKLLQDQ
jgi:DNA primase